MHNASEAKRVVRLGQVNRKVFGTVANKESSRSHAILTVRVERVKLHEGKEEQVCRFSRLPVTCVLMLLVGL